MRRILTSLALVAAIGGLGACGADNVWAPDEQVEAVRYQDDGPPTLTLFTVISNRSGAGAHSGLMVSGSQRVLFDPAGTWNHPYLPERHDVHFGITDAAVDFYVDYHARVTYNVVRQDIVVSPEVAEMALRLVQENGPVAKAMCSTSVTAILRQLPGFESIPQSAFPKRPMKAFGQLPGVVETVTYDDDPDENGYILARGIARLDGVEAEIWQADAAEQ